jgi:hypothetical protein
VFLNHASSLLSNTKLTCTPTQKVLTTLRSLETGSGIIFSLGSVKLQGKKRQLTLRLMKQRFANSKTKAAIKVQTAFRGHWARTLNPIRTVNHVPANRIQCKCLFLVI